VNPRSPAIFLVLILAVIPPLAAQSIIAPGSVAPGDPFPCWVAFDRPVLEASAILKDAVGRKLSSAVSFFMPSGADDFLYGFFLAVPVKTQPGSGYLLITIVFDNGHGGQTVPISVLKRKNS
jgi:hypothetical protein